MVDSDNPVLPYTGQDSKELLGIVKNVIAKEMDLDPSDINPGSLLRDDLDINSLDATNILMTLEQRFQLEADLEDFLEMRTVEDVQHLINQHLVASSTSSGRYISRGG